MRRHFIRRAWLFLAVFFTLVFLASGLAVALLSGAFGIDRTRGLVVPAGVLGLVLLTVLFVVAARVVRRLAAPVGEVMEAADRVAAGEYSVRVPERGAREVRRLARSFNAMVERLAAQERQRRDLLADVTHELRTPLSVIQGDVEGMMDGVYPPDAAHLGPVLEETKVMAHLLNDLQTLSTAEAGALRLNRQPVDPAELVADAVAAYQPRARAAGLTLEGRPAPALTSVDVDPMRVGEVLGNLLANAVRHTPSGGSILLSAEPADDGRAVAFTVRDTGPGIPAESLPHVFDRFVKGTDSRGSGLGLAIARSLIEAHGGRIAAESTPGEGATVRFQLPVIET